mmetsp:Transcript_129640/g.415767  ORF Transcript_129640/g.415767 Transcript_129640/m.415767 type:complete len:816 (+) Transcript_129640:54-2501(+)|eukprot:CAMPEP_0203861240 /NCGR_PEP_ID=MMETSP0359-20131031/12892_1 /ASSEMBLY_ACC=CAM_ASM_000338 /TAXON_ID=268821 /ORGANISM="Scrippsiella Hangoei, Strain SHTV-5" /LENGTH=815 /DNA_ID=CAMNT_0050778439 /DNA_START=34 /DNA_END=2481 /DNA_ORIENTATION=-
MANVSESLNDFINLRSSTCLNEASEHPFSHCLIDDEKQLQSDADHQLLFDIHFTEPVHLAKLHFAAAGDDAPTVIKLFVNKPNMGFDDAESQVATQEITLQLESEVEAVVQLKPLQFKGVHSLVVFVAENAGAEVTSLRYLEVFGIRARGRSALEAPPAVVGKRQKKVSTSGALGEVASRLSAQGSEEGVARCLLEVAAGLSPLQGRELVHKASEVFLSAAPDSGDKRRRALLLLGACQCQVLCLQRGPGAVPLPSETRGAMRTAVQGLMSALEGVVDAKALRPLLESLIAQKGLGQLRGAEEFMHLLCRLAGPLLAPACDRGEVQEDVGDSESEASEIDEAEAGVQCADRKPGLAGAASKAEGKGCRMARVAALLETLRDEPVEADGMASEEEVTCLQPNSRQLEEFVASMAVDAAAAATWPVIYPGPGGHGLRFEASFQGGNLRRVRSESDGVVEVLLCGDTKRSYHCQSFCFDAIVDVPLTLRFRIVSFSKPGSTFTDGQRIVTRPEGMAAWRRDGHDYAYVPNRYTIGQRRRHYTLAFTLSLRAGRTRVAHFYPYLYGDVLQDLRRLGPSGDWLNVSDLGPTPGGRPLLMLTITDFEVAQATEGPDVRPHIVISARVHPGEVPASFMMRGALELLLSDAEEARDLRRRFVFVALPMLNPDGVAAGNGRANGAGLDLNRCWERPPEGSEIVAARRALQELCASPGGLLAYLDLHAHSRRHGAFTLSNPSTQALPDLLAEMDDGVFDRKQCVFSYNKSKRGSARCVVWRDLGVKHSHTVEATYAALPGRKRLVTPRDLSELGQNLVRGCAKLG